MIETSRPCRHFVEQAGCRPPDHPFAVPCWGQAAQGYPKVPGTRCFAIRCSGFLMFQCQVNGTYWVVKVRGGERRDWGSGINAWWTGVEDAGEFIEDDLMIFFELVPFFPGQAVFEGLDRSGRTRRRF